MSIPNMRFVGTYPTLDGNVKASHANSIKM